MLLLAKLNNKNGVTRNDFCLKGRLEERLFGNKGMETTGTQKHLHNHQLYNF
jgi:hypothetical protein